MTPRGPARRAVWPDGPAIMAPGLPVRYALDSYPKELRARREAIFERQEPAVVSSGGVVHEWSVFM